MRGHQVNGFLVGERSCGPTNQAGTGETLLRLNGWPRENTPVIASMRSNPDSYDRCAGSPRALCASRRLALSASAENAPSTPRMMARPPDCPWSGPRISPTPRLPLSPAPPRPPEIIPNTPPRTAACWRAALRPWPDVPVCSCAGAACAPARRALEDFVGDSDQPSCRRHPPPARPRISCWRWASVMGPICPAAAR